MKESFYFPHDLNSRDDEKILKLRAKFNNAYGYGVYWFLIERMAESSNGFIDGSALAELELSLGLAKDSLADIIKFCLSIGLFVEEGDLITTNRIQQHRMFRKERSESGKRGAASTWGKNSSANSSAISSAGDQLIASKGKESKLNEITSNAYVANATYDLDTPITYLNEKAGTKFNPKAKFNRTIVRARYNEGYKLEDFKAVIDRKCADWMTDDKMNTYLRPETLFCASKFEGYLNQKRSLNELKRSLFRSNQ